MEQNLLSWSWKDIQFTVPYKKLKLIRASQ